MSVWASWLETRTWRATSFSLALEASRTQATHARHRLDGRQLLAPAVRFSGLRAAVEGGAAARAAIGILRRAHIGTACHITSPLKSRARDLPVRYRFRKGTDRWQTSLV